MTLQITIAAIGKLKAGPELALFDQYLKRLPWKISVKEYEIKKQLSGLARKVEEAELLLKACEQADHIIALDEGGKYLSSIAFSQHFQKQQDEGSRHIAFVIGGADGLHEKVKRRAHLMISFGRVTWPHMLMRAMLAEQMYRAYSIMTHHPYHRE